MNCQVKDELVSRLIALNNKLNLLSPDLVHGDEERAKCNSNVRAYTPRSSTTGRKDTKANRALRQNRSRPVVPAWPGKRISAVRANTVPFSIIFQFQVL